MEKRGNITGGLVTDQFLDSSRTATQRNIRGRKGAQQFYTPPHVARFIAHALVGNTALAEDQVPTCDPTGAGAGNLLEPYNARFGIEVDTDQRNARYHKILWDCQPATDVGRAIDLCFPRIVANPPWGLQWEAFGHKGRSAQVALTIACKWLHRQGFGAIIMPDTDYVASIEKYGPRTLCVVHLPDDTFEGVDVPSVIVFFAGRQVHYRTVSIPEYHPDLRPCESVSGPCQSVARSIRAAIQNVHVGYPVWKPDDIAKKFSLLQEEFRRRARNQGNPVSSITISGSRRSPRLRIYISPIDRMRIDSGQPFDYELLESVRRNHGQSAWQFCFDRKQWRRLLELCQRLDLPIDPEVHDTYARLQQHAARVFAPMMTLDEEVLAVAALRDTERIRCKKEDPEHGFMAGEEYAIESETIERTEVEERLVPVPGKDAKTGLPVETWENTEFRLESRGLQFKIEEAS